MSKLNSAWCHSVLLVVLQPETRQTLFLIFMLGWAIVGTGWPFSAVFCPTEHLESCQFQLAVYIKQTRRARKNTEDLERDRAPSNKRKELHKCGEGNCERDRKLAKTKLTTTWRYNNSPESSSHPRKTDYCHLVVWRLIAFQLNAERTSESAIGCNCCWTQPTWQHEVSQPSSSRCCLFFAASGPLLITLRIWTLSQTRLDRVAYPFQRC